MTPCPMNKATRSTVFLTPPMALPSPVGANVGVSQFFLLRVINVLLQNVHSGLRSSFCHFTSSSMQKLWSLVSVSRIISTPSRFPCPVTAITQLECSIIEYMIITSVMSPWSSFHSVPPLGH